MSKRSSLVFKAIAPLAVLGAIAAIPACVSSDSGGGDATGGTGTTGGGASSTSTVVNGGANATGGANGTSPGTAVGGSGVGGASTVATDAAVCLPVTLALISDFSYDETATPAPALDQVTFGNYTDTFSGGTTFWGGTDYKSDVTGDSWHMSGNISTWTGFALFMSVPTGGCSKVDASAYKGISFAIKGTPLPATRTLTFEVNTVANQISSTWMNANTTTVTAANLGACTPTANQWDGTCKSFSYSVPVTEAGATVTINWADFTGGAPAATLDPATITNIDWFFSWGGDTDTAYPVDITIDDLSFIP